MEKAASDQASPVCVEMQVLRNSGQREASANSSALEATVLVLQTFAFRDDRVLAYSFSSSFSFSISIFFESLFTVCFRGRCSTLRLNKSSWKISV